MSTFRVGDRVEAKYRGTGTVSEPPKDALAAPRFDDDIFVKWDSGEPMWVGPDVLSRKS